MSKVLVIDRAAWFAGNWPQGFRPMFGSAGDSFLAGIAALARYEDRATAEANPAWKQWIPYCVLRQIDPGSGRLSHVCIVQRSRGQSEARLHGAYSIGLGGHIEPADGEPSRLPATEFFAAALQRELAEELVLALPPGSSPRFLGLLNDDATAVGAVHAGLVYAIDLPTGSPAAAALQIREIGKMSGGWGSLAELRKLWLDRQRFETWSRWLVEAGIAGDTGLPAAAAAADCGRELPHQQH